MSCDWFSESGDTLPKSFASLQRRGLALAPAALALFFGACEEAPQGSLPTPEPGNSAPRLLALALVPAQAFTNTELTCVPKGSDPDRDPISYLFEWTVDGVKQAGNGPKLDSDAFAKGQKVRCTAIAHDGNLHSDPKFAEVMIQNSSPTVGEVLVQAQGPGGIEDTLHCTGTSTDRDGDNLTLSFSWSIGGVALGDGPTIDLSTISDLSRGDSVRCTATATDDGGLAAIGHHEFTVLNTAPIVKSIAVQPDAAVTTAPVHCIAETADVDGDNVTLLYSWTVNGAIVQGTGASLDASAFQKGQFVRCTATPHDGELAGEAAYAELVIGNTAPTVTGLAIGPDPARVGTDLVCAPTAGDDDGDDVTFSFIWTVDGAFVDVSGNALSAQYFSKGQTVSCLVTPHDGIVPGPPASIQVVIENTPPVITEVVMDPYPAYSSSPIYCLPAAVDADGDRINFEYSWAIDGVIAAETGSNLSQRSYSKGQTVRCTAIPHDGTHAGEPVFTEVVIQNTAPIVTEVIVEPASDGGVLDTLYCDATTADSDGDRLVVTYSWMQGEALVGDGNSVNLSVLEGLQRGDLVRCIAEASDDQGAIGTAYRDFTVLNTPPVVDSVLLLPEIAFTTTALDCEVDFSDVDGDQVSASYAWTVAGVPVGGNSSTLAASAFVKGQVVRCSATPHDGVAAGEAVFGEILIQNSAPSQPAVTMGPEAVFANTTITCNATNSTDPDGDQVQYTYQWSVNGSVQPSTGPTLPPGSHSVGQTVRCDATPTDGSSQGASNYAQVVVANTAPTAPTVEITVDESSGDLMCTLASPAVDIDNDQISYTVEWFLDGIPFANAEQTTIPGDTVIGENLELFTFWQCVVTPFDGTDFGSPASKEIFYTLPFVFSNAGATGRQGPSQLAIDEYYLDTRLEGSVTATPSGIQRWVVPMTSSYRVEVRGAQGATSNGNGGEGAIVRGVVDLNQGDVLWILVGQQGSGSPGVYQNVGGAGGSFVSIGPVHSTSEPLFVAGGGSSTHNLTDKSFSKGSTNNWGNAGNNGNTAGGAGGVDGQAGGIEEQNGTTAAAGFYGSGNSAMSFLEGGLGAVGTPVGTDGGFGGGGAATTGGYSKVGGGGGYSGGGSSGGSNGYTFPGGGGGSFVTAEARSVATSNGNYNGSNSFGGKPVINLGSYQKGHGAVRITPVME